jgi:F-type H+-transporting ATPase subunit delta
MKIPKQARRAAKELFHRCLRDGLLDEAAVRATVTQVVATKPRQYIPILSHFQRLVRLYLNAHSAKVESAAPLAPDLQNSIKSALFKNYGEGLSVTFATNPALIGGMRVKVGSDVYDGSVQAKLAALQESF